jgi:hypothetical protein
VDLAQVYDPGSEENGDDVNRAELDSHADTCVAGANTVPLWFTDQTVNVSPFIGEYTPIGDIPIASVATAWDDPSTGRTIILVINEALYFGDRMSYTLLCPNQLRCNGVRVNEVPPAFADPGTPHSIIVPGRIEIPLKMRGVMSYIESRRPTTKETKECEHIELTSANPWQPHSLDLFNPPSVDEILPRSVYLCHKENPPELNISSLNRLSAATASAVTHEVGSVAVIHEADVISHDHSHRQLMSTKTGMKASSIAKEDLAKRWYISHETAARTLDVTTQQGLRYVEGPLERRLRTSQAHMRFPTLNIVTYTDTMFSSNESVRGYTCTQVFMDGHFFCRVYPMRMKGDAPHALMMFIHEVGVPKTLLSDRAFEEMRGQWGRIVKQYHIDHRTTEIKSPWQNRMEAEIRELKKLKRRTLKKSRAPAEMWCYAIEWAARIRSLTAHDALLLKEC